MIFEVDIVVIGGGISACSCFYDLCSDASEGHTTVLLEGRDRFGGRSCTEKVLIEGDEYSVDTGGQWLGACHNTILGICKEMGVQLENQPYPDSQNQTQAQIIGEEREGEGDQALCELAYYKMKELVPEATAEVEAFKLYVKECFRKINKATGTTSASDAESEEEDFEALIDLKIEWDRISVLQVAVSLCSFASAIQEISYFVQTVLSVDPKDCSFLFFLHHVFVFGGGDEGMELLGDGPQGLQALKIAGGTQQISEWLIAGALKCDNGTGKSGNQAILNCNVVSIDLSNIDQDADPSSSSLSCIKVKCVDGREFICKRVIIGLAPTMFTNTITITPPSIIDNARAELYSSMISGCAVKVIVVFAAAFWRDIAAPPSRAKAIEDMSICHNIFESSVGPHPALVCLITGSYATRYHSMQEGERRELMLDQLRDMYASYTEPLVYIEKDWIAETLSGGCFAAVFPPTPNASFAQSGHLLLEPLVPNMVWNCCCEATDSFYGYLEGAALSGKRVAREVLETIKSEPKPKSIEDY